MLLLTLPEVYFKVSIEIVMWKLSKSQIVNLGFLTCIIATSGLLLDTWVAQPLNLELHMLYASPFMEIVIPGYFFLSCDLALLTLEVATLHFSL